MPSTPRAPIIWVTRTAPYNRLTARRLRSAGFDPLIEPALRVVPLPSAKPIAVPDALVFTSLQGVRLHRYFPSLADIPVFAVGDHSARLAQRRGYRRVTSASGDVHDLCHLIRESMPLGANILHMSAARPAGDLPALLSKDGFVVRRQCVYETVEAGALALEWIAGVLADIDTILVHSPRAGRHVAAWLDQQRPHWSGLICCISAAAAAPFHELANARVAIATQPDETMLLNTLLSQKRLAMHGSGSAAGAS